ncbi:MAG: extracellular solute-binding protein [Candidatus Ornithospirochaeta sp.]
MKKALIIALATMMIALPVFAQGAQETSAAADAPAKLTYWAPMSTKIKNVNDFSELPYWQEVMKRTNTEIEFTNVSAETKILGEQFSILQVSSDLPDIVEYKWASYVGGPQSAIDDGFIIPLNDVFEKYCPNITKYLEEHPDIAKECSTDDGTYYCFPFFRGYDYNNNGLLFSEGTIYRMDILKSLGFENPPETADELYEVLVAIKNAGVVEIPMSVRPDHINRVFAPAFDSWDSWYVEDGQVKHGYLQQNRYDYLSFVHKIYAEGLLDNDYMSVNKNGMNSMFLSGKIAIGYNPGSLIATAVKTMENVEISSAKPLSKVKGRNSMFAKMNTVFDTAASSSAAITTSCKNVEAAARLLDYAYGEEGHLLANFGIEGVTYTMVDGYPTYTAFVNENKDEVMSKYMRCSVNGAIIQDPRYLEQYYDTKEQAEALSLWSQTDYGKYMLPPVSISSEDGTKAASIINKVNTYAEEMETKFITGAIELNEKTFAEYQAQLRAFGLEDAVAIYQKAYEAYLAK